MKWNIENPATDSAHQPIESLSFDMLRALVTTRQAMSPTAKLVAGAAARIEDQPKRSAASPIAVLSSHAVGQVGGAFCALFSASDAFQRSGTI